MIPALIGVIGVKAFDLDVPDVGYLFIAVVFCNPPFLYFLSFFFDKDESGSFFVKILFFLIGVIAPIAVSVLQVVKNTIDFAKWFKWVFYPVPIYSLTFGYMSIAQRSIIQLVTKATDVEPLGKNVAGPAVAFLIGMTPVYWILVACWENKVFDCLKKGRGESDNSEFRAH